MSEETRRVMLCICNEGHEESLDLNKTYEVLEDRRATDKGMLRVIDEEGEDYLYPRQWFVPT